MGKILSILTVALALLAGAHKISSVETSGSWVYLYDDSGHRYKTLSASSVGVVKGYCSEFFVSQNGSWIYLYDSEGQRYKTLSASSVGEVTGVSGETFTSRNGAWVYTWDKGGKKVNTRTARRLWYNRIFCYICVCLNRLHNGSTLHAMQAIVVEGYFIF